MILKSVPYDIFFSVSSVQVFIVQFPWKQSFARIAEICGFPGIKETSRQYGQLWTTCLPSWSDWLPKPTPDRIPGQGPARASSISTKEALYLQVPPEQLDLLFLPDSSSRIRSVKSGPLCCPVPRGIDPLQHRYIVPRASLILHLGPDYPQIFPRAKLMTICMHAILQIIVVLLYN